MAKQQGIAVAVLSALNPTITGFVHLGTNQCLGWLRWIPRPLPTDCSFSSELRDNFANRSTRAFSAPLAVLVRQLQGETMVVKFLVIQCVNHPRRALDIIPTLFAQRI